MSELQARKSLAVKLAAFDSPTALLICQHLPVCASSSPTSHSFLLMYCSRRVLSIPSLAFFRFTRLNSFLSISGSCLLTLPEPIAAPPQDHCSFYFSGLILQATSPLFVLEPGQNVSGRRPLLFPLFRLTWLWRAAYSTENVVWVHRFAA